jgi:hypothetical protein
MITQTGRIAPLISSILIGTAEFKTNWRVPGLVELIFSSISAVLVSFGILELISSSI